MEYRGVEYAIVRTIPNGFRWSVKRDHNDKVGKATDKREALRYVQKFIDELLKGRAKEADSYTVIDGRLEPKE